MVRTRFQLQYVWPTALTSLFLLGLCTAIALLLLREQARTTESLSENLASRRAVAELEESLVDLIALLRDRVEGVSALHARIETHLSKIQHFADKAEEAALANALSESYRNYLELFQHVQEALPAQHPAALRDAISFLETSTLRRCQRLSDFNSRQIEESEQEHRRALGRMAWGICTVGVTGAAAGLLLGYGVARGLWRSIRRLQIYLRDAAGKLGRTGPMLVLTDEGDLDQLQDRMQELVGRIERVVSELHEREREVLRADQLKAVGQLAAGVAHEIRNPLTSIKMLVQAGREDPAGNALTSEDLEVIEREVRRVERSLNNFLGFARPPRPERSTQDLAALVRQTFDLVRGRADKQGVTLRFDLPRWPVTLDADGEQIKQVLVNLVLNSLDAMPGGGLLEVSLSSEESGWITLAILDSGPGIAPAVMARLFEPFHSTKPTGLGLGLVTSRRIVEEHGGDLTGSNRPTGGASFSVTLPTGRPVAETVHSKAATLLTTDG